MPGFDPNLRSPLWSSKGTFWPYVYRTRVSSPSRHYFTTHKQLDTQLWKVQEQIFYQYIWLSSLHMQDCMGTLCMCDLTMGQWLRSLRTKQHVHNGRWLVFTDLPQEQHSMNLDKMLKGNIFEFLLMKACGTWPKGREKPTSAGVMSDCRFWTKTSKKGPWNIFDFAVLEYSTLLIMLFWRCMRVQCVFSHFNIPAISSEYNQPPKPLPLG